MTNRLISAAVLAGFKAVLAVGVAFVIIAKVATAPVRWARSLR